MVADMEVDKVADKVAVLHYMSSWDWVGMYFKMVGMDHNRYDQILVIMS